MLLDFAADGVLVGAGGGAEDDAVGAGLDVGDGDVGPFGLADEHGDVEGGGVAAGGGGKLVELADLLAERLGSEAVGNPAVAVLHHTGEDVLGVAADQDRRVGLLDGLGVAAQQGEVVELAVELGALLRPQLLQHEAGFEGLRPRPADVAAHDGGLFLVPAGADAEDEAPAAVAVEGGDLLGEEQRVALGHEQDARPDSDVGGRRRRQGHGNDRVHEAGHLPAGEDRRIAGALDGRDGMVGDPERLEAGVLDVLRHDGGVDVDGGRLRWVGQLDADLHGVRLRTASP